MPAGDVAPDQGVDMLALRAARIPLQHSDVERRASCHMRRTRKPSPRLDLGRAVARERSCAMSTEGEMRLISILPLKGVTIHESDNQLWVETQGQGTLLEEKEAERILTGTSPDKPRMPSTMVIVTPSGTSSRAGPPAPRRRRATPLSRARRYVGRRSSRARVWTRRRCE